MYLQVIFISDICNGQGTEIENQFWSGMAILNLHNYRWPHSHKPNSSEWVLWQWALTRSLNLGNARKLPIPLGKWDPMTKQTNGWFTNEASLQLFHQKEQEWLTFMPLPLCKRLCSFIDRATPTTLQALPKWLYHATVYNHGNMLTITGYGPMKSEPMDTPPNPLVQFWQQWQ